jgi:Pectate lyase superfamily protein
MTRSNLFYVALVFAVALGQTSNMTGQAAHPVSVKDFGAKGDGVTDDTKAIQAALTSVPTGTVTFPVTNGCYKSGNLMISNKTDFVLEGNHQEICWTGTANADEFIGFQYSGSLTNVTIQNFRLIGDEVLGHRHCGVWGRSGARLVNLRVTGNYIHNVTLGISINAERSGSISRFSVDHNNIDTVLGTEPGSGYGIHHANGSGNPSDGTIEENTIAGTQRHGIYQAKGSRVLIRKNTILNHRQAVPEIVGSPRPAVQIARSTYIAFEDNVIEGAKDGSLQVALQPGTTCDHITVSGTTITRPVGPQSPVTIGTSDPQHDGICTNVRFSNSNISYELEGSPALQIDSGKHVLVLNNVFSVTSRSREGAVIGLRGYGEGPGTALYTDDVTFSGNKISASRTAGALHALAIYRGAAGAGMHVTFESNTYDVPGDEFWYEIPAGNPNLKILDQRRSGRRP